MVLEPSECQYVYVSALDILEALIDFQPSLGKLYHIVGGLNRLVARLLSAGSAVLREKLIAIINRLPNDGKNHFLSIVS